MLANFRLKITVKPGQAFPPKQLCTPLTETSGATVSICEGGEQAVDRLLQNFPGIPSTIYSPSDFNFLTRKLQTAPSHSRKSFPNCFASPPFFNWSAGGAWCSYMARLLFINPINIRLLNRGSIRILHYLFRE